MIWIYKNFSKIIFYRDEKKWLFFPKFTPYIIQDPYFIFYVLNYLMIYVIDKIYTMILNVYWN